MWPHTCYLFIKTTVTADAIDNLTKQKWKITVTAEAEETELAEYDLCCLLLINDLSAPDFCQALLIYM